MIFNGVIQVTGGGGGTKAAHGTAGGDYTDSFTVSGIGFEPSFVLITTNPRSVSPERNPYVFTVIANDVSSNNDCLIREGQSFYSGKATFSPLEDGFTVTVSGCQFSYDFNYYWAAFE